MPSKRARFIKLKRKPPEINPEPFTISPMMAAMIASPGAASRIAPCKCMKKNNKWYCMKPNGNGQYLMIDGPFASEKECLEKAVCG